ncbi:NitT/TauT family transport system permease protein [Faunimonas pinastri]|uniref:NitT/TauT family transport system permease protein n=1 Tax=Faunimonas pinastri TaxID=1855383 RepID=A0A1H9EPU5_9HYPH|nr:ABC transporter permease [Faunimonas pinastri]SEQ27669.1 NitT/TauT family transport system permease protein [Faunimonas pinastri]
MSSSLSGKLPEFGRFPERIGAILPPVVLIVALILLWSWSAGTGLLPKWLLPSPQAVLGEFSHHSATLLKHARMTAFEALGGFALGALAGAGGAFLLTLVPFLRDMLYPYALASRAIPIIVFTPLIVVMLGRGLVPIILIVAFATYFPVFLALLRGLNTLNADRMELLHSLSATPLQILWKIRLPSSLPMLFAALKVSASGAFITALVTEWIGSNVGLGYLVMVSGQYFKLATMWAAIFSASLMTLALLGLIVLIERLMGRYTSLATEV